MIMILKLYMMIMRITSQHWWRLYDGTHHHAVGHEGDDDDEDDDEEENDDDEAHLPQRALNLKSCLLPIFLQEPLKHL